MSKLHTHRLEKNEKADETLIFGFWVYLMTDCVLFAGLFATFVILRGFAHVSGSELFSLPYVLTETIILLTSSFTCGLAILAAYRDNKRQVLSWLLATFLLGASFLGMELTEFARMFGEGHGWNTSAFLSSYFTLVGTHGLHITLGLLWMAVMTALIIKRGPGSVTLRRLVCLSLFWHFLDIVWIFIFTIVYLMGVL